MSKPFERQISAESLTARGGLVRETLDPDRTLDQDRADWDKAASATQLAEGCHAEEDRIGAVPCLWLRPAGATSKDLLVYAHGGGLVTGSLLTHRAFGSELATALQRTVLLVGYRLLPENPFTAPRDDFVAVYRALLASGEHKADRIIFAGDSSGAAVALSASVQLRQVQAPQPRAIVSLSGAFDASLSGDSVQALADTDPQLSPDVLADWQKTFRGRIDLKDPVISPLFADLAGTPPTLLLAGGHELWLSDSERMYRSLRSADVPARLSIYPGMWHVWPMWPGLPETVQAFDEIDRFLDGDR